MVKTSICLINIIFLVLLGLLAIEAAPYQELEPRKGHVPVYIRHGDEPLSEIHPGLAEAFKEGQSKSPDIENLVTQQPEEVTTLETTTSSATSPPPTSTESDIASFDAIKGATKEE
ncbi:uncharacterized protein Dana_GF24782 [Drosophila ananassae]|uniref:DUF4794 domain-containing protein n=1 Tax=Drosophila ananassae TaxID=7217 RepID=B3M8D7_DROAN|nr:uncharacterized protein LOC6507412 [Drosophila ananassae]EDV38872.1 uncharacterized protein Dana_GF24782 [Drosophila ananassae]